MTVLNEVAMIVNCRPFSLMFTSDLEEPLTTSHTPLTTSHIMCGHQLMNIPEDVQIDDNEEEVDATFETTPMTFLNTVYGQDAVQ